MPRDLKSLSALCLAAASLRQSHVLKIKAIAQIAHEHLKTSSIVVYAFNQLSGELDLVAMPGVAEREFMRGPTDKLVFHFEDPPSKYLSGEVVWLEGEESFKDYLTFLAQQCGLADEEILNPSAFRLREKTQATAKAYLFQGPSENPGAKVGMIFFNFTKNSEENTFSRRVRSAILFISDLIREVLIESHFPAVSSPVPWNPDTLIRQINVLAENGKAKPQEQQVHLARLILNAALRVSENFGGHGDIILLVGAGSPLGLVVSAEDTPAAPETYLVPRSSLVANVINKKTLFYAPNLHGLTKKSEKMSSQARSTKDGVFEGATGGIICPILYNKSVRAIIRLFPSPGATFQDDHARVVQNLELVARYAVSRQLENRTRLELSEALDFYNSELTKATTIDIDKVMPLVVRALGAEWGTFWLVEPNEDGKSFQALRGTKFTKDGSEPVKHEDALVGVRQDHGFSCELLRVGGRNPECILALHVLPQHKRHKSSDQSEYYVTFFSKSPLPIKNTDIQCFRLSDDFLCYGFTDRDSISDPQPIRLNPNSHRGPQGVEEPHTRIAFFIHVNNKPKALVWLMFSSLHEVSWWERRYLTGLSTTISRMLSTDTLNVVLRNFRHMMPNFGHEAILNCESIQKQFQRDRCHPACDESISYLLAYHYFVFWKLLEAQALLSRRDVDLPETLDDIVRAKAPLREFVELAVLLVTKRPTEKQTTWTVLWQDETVEQTITSSVLFSVLVNLMWNAIKHAGWQKWLPEYRKGYIFSRKDGDLLHVYVANIGSPVSRERLTSVLHATGSDDHVGIGLRVCKQILERCNGKLEPVESNELESIKCEKVNQIKNCDVIIRVTIPI